MPAFGFLPAKFTRIHGNRVLVAWCFLAMTGLARLMGAPDSPADEISPNGEIVGQLTDAESDKPIEGATVACSALTTDSGKGGGANAVTDANGQYRLRVASPGFYNVWLNKYDHDASKTAAADDGIHVEAGKIAISQMHLVTGRIVTGKVIDADGKVFVGVPVSCYSSARPAAGGPETVRAKADGGFEFKLPPGRAHIYSYEPAKNGRIPFAIGRAADAYIQVKANGDVPPVVMTLVDGHAKMGDPIWLMRSTVGTEIVRHADSGDVTGVVIDSDGKPIAGASVFPENRKPALSNEKGEFRVSMGGGTQFVMHAVAPGYHAWFGTPIAGDELKIVLDRKP